MVRDRILVYPPHLLRTAGLSALLWFALHAALAVLGVFRLSTPAVVLTALICAAAVHMEMRRNSAHIFFANLGIAPGQGAVIALLTVVLLEILLRLSAGALGLS